MRRRDESVRSEHLGRRPDLLWRRLVLEPGEATSCSPGMEPPPEPE
jgi:hypothetical protein